MQTKVNLSLKPEAFVDIPGGESVDTGEGNGSISCDSGEANGDFSGLAYGDISCDGDKVNGETISLANVDVPCENHLGKVTGDLPCDTHGDRPEAASISIWDEEGPALHDGSSRRIVFIFSQLASEILSG